MIGWIGNGVSKQLNCKDKMEIESKNIGDILKEVKAKYSDTYRYMAKSIN